MKLYRGLDKDKLTAQYNVTADIDNVPEIFERFTVESRSFRECNIGHLDVAYADRTTSVCDVFSKQRGSPVHIFLHGGYCGCSVRMNGVLSPKVWLEAGATVVIANYALCPAVTLTQIVNEIRDLVVWTYDNIGNYGADPTQIYLSGHSVGGHLVAMMLATDWEGQFELPKDVISGAVAISGIYDLTPIRYSYLQEDVRLSEDEVFQLSPINHAVKNSGPLVVAVGGKESAEFHRQTSEYATYSAVAGNSVTRVELPGHDHLSLLWDLSDSKGRLCTSACQQMGLTK